MMHRVLLMTVEFQQDQTVLLNLFLLLTVRVLWVRTVSGDSDGVDIFLDEESGALFLRTDARTKEWGIGLREVNSSSGMEIVSPTSIFLGSSSGFVLAMAFQFFTAPVYHFAM